MKQTGIVMKAKMTMGAVCMVLMSMSNFTYAYIGLPVLNGQQYRPHYWDLPTEFKGSFMFPGQMIFNNSTSTKYDASGKKVDIGSTQYATVGITAIPNVFKFKYSDSWAYAGGIDLLEVKMSSSDPAQAKFSGVGNVMADFIAWTKPDANSTVGYNVILGTPVNLVGDDLPSSTHPPRFSPISKVGPHMNQSLSSVFLVFSVV